MGRVGWFLFGVLIGAGGVYGASKYHIVQAKDGFYMVPKLVSGFEETYADIRGYDFADWTAHPSLAAALIKADRGDLVRQTVENQVKEAVGGLLENAVPKPAPAPKE